MSVFNVDVNALMETTYRGEIDTQWHAVPIGEYMAQIEDVKLREVEFRRVEGKGVGIDITWNIQDDDVKKQMNVEKPQARQSFLLDLTPDGRSLDWGTNRNMRLKAIRAAVGMTKGNFNLSMLKHQVAYVKIEHRPDQDDPEVIYAEVRRVTSLDRAQRAAAAE